MVKAHVEGADPSLPEVRAMPAGVGRSPMGFDVLILNSGEWLLTGELPAIPWHVLVYSQRGAPANQLHVWLPRDGARGSGRYAFKRFWQDASGRWCVEIPTDAQAGLRHRARLRFSADDGRVLWSENPAARGLADLSDADLARLLDSGSTGSFSGH
jgi:hypothetical protein